MTQPDPIHRSAVLSDDGRYRYELVRAWGTGPWACFVMLNPSTADASVDDATIRKCVAYARAWGLDGIVVANLFAWRSTDPRALLTEAGQGVDIVGPENDARLAALASRRNALGPLGGPVVAAWGAHVATLHRNRASVVLARLRELGPVHCLRETQGGAPAHPLYLPGDLKPCNYKGLP